jgi:hypothetical protein
MVQIMEIINILYRQDVTERCRQSGHEFHTTKQEKLIGIAAGFLDFVHTPVF